MFGRDQNKLVQSLLEKSGAVCGSIQNTIQDEDNIEWVKSKAEGVRLKGVECAHTAYQNLNSEEERKDAAGIMEASHDMSQTISDESTEATYSTDGASTRDNNKLRGATSTSSRGRAVGSVPSVSSSVSVPQTVVIGLCLSRKSGIGHAGTVTRQTEYDFNELQDRDYKYVSSTDERGWLAGGGERRDPHVKPSELEIGDGDSHKVAAPDTVHIPIIEINTVSAAAVNEIVAALARGEIFIPHMSILPESLTVKGKSPPDLVVSFGCEKNDDANPEDWSNWCLEFLHNQLYEYFAPLGAQWSKRPFQITLARNVKWKTIKHMNKYFARSENVINSWREKGAQYLTPQKDAVGVTNEEITNPHGIYLLRNGKATNYFPPNFEPPYTTNVTRSLIRNVVNKSWDAKHRDWLVEPLPLYRGPIQIISSILGCASAPGCATIKAIDMSALDVSCADDMTLVADLSHDGKVGRKQKKGKTPLKEMKPNHGEVKQNHSAGHEEKTDYKSNVAPENNGNDPQHREEEGQNFDDLNRAFEDKISIQKEALNAEKYAKTKVRRLNNYNFTESSFT